MGYSDHERLRGVAGWLAFLCILFLFIAPAWNLIGTAIEFGAAEREFPGLSEFPQWRSMKIYMWLLAAAVSALSIYTGWRLNSVHRPSSVRLATAMLWVLGPGAVLMAAAVVSATLDASVLGDMATSRDMGRAFVAAAFWTAYLSASRRVKNTYYAEEEAVAAEDPAR